MRKTLSFIDFRYLLMLALPLIGFLTVQCTMYGSDPLKEGFINPPDSVRPGAYWYFMDGNINREAMTKDLESMKNAGLGYVIFLEVNVGVPRGKVDFLSEEWQDLFVHAVRECERLGIQLILGSGPGWAGSGGPWVKPEQSMMHLVAADTVVEGPFLFQAALSTPMPRNPFFGEGVLTAELKDIRDAWYEDVAVLAFPLPEETEPITDIDEKALYYRAPYTSQKGVKSFLPSQVSYDETPAAAVNRSEMLDLTSLLKPDGSIEWSVPEGKWKIMRFGKRNNGAVTRPAPVPGLGFECDKFSASSFDDHFDAYVGKLLKKAGKRNPSKGGGWSMIHIDSWEMGAQNWTDDFREQFTQRRGYDPLLYLPTYTGQIVESRERSERFLWDVRLTSQELIIENHARRFKELGQQHGLSLSIEPYDMNPTADLDLGSVADIPMCEFWTDQYGFNSAFSCIESTSIAHVQGKSVVAAEAFTGDPHEAWRKYPGNMKNQGDWAFCMGINRFMYHTFAHKAYDDELKPGMAMGPYGVHWDRGQTWWSMVPAYHQYVSRCQYLLMQGRPVADILYLTPEGAPHVFRPPASAMEGSDVMPDKRGYSFDGCSPLLLEVAEVEEGRIVFPGGASYRILVLPNVETMTPGLLKKIESLAEAGALITGRQPLKSPSLTDYPDCDEQVKTIASRLWDNKLIDTTGYSDIPQDQFSGETQNLLYPTYDVTSALLRKTGVDPDFTAESGAIRYVHRSLPEREIYFISNRSDQLVHDNCRFRDGTLHAELWDAVTGEMIPINGLNEVDGGVSLHMKLEPSQSFFIVFDKSANPVNRQSLESNLFGEKELIKTLEGDWNLSFDPRWGGPENVVFDSLADWTTSNEEEIRYYSGIATYTKKFNFPESSLITSGRYYLDLGKVKNIASVKLNGKDMGVVWTSPWQVDITSAVKAKGNLLEVDVANLWINRLIGDELLPDDGIREGKWPDWVLDGSPRPSSRFTFTTYRYYKKGDELQESGLLGPVNILGEKVK